MKKILLLLLLLLFAVVLCAPIAVSKKEAETFAEGLFLKPLPDRKLLAHFHFQSQAPDFVANGRHHRVFSKAVAQLFIKFQIRELELSFTQGRWDYERWGTSDSLSNPNAKPPGVELWADFDVQIDQTDVTWKSLTHALSGLFCSSINFLESSAAYTTPHWGFNSNSSNVRYGALPREAVCTENLTPWLKLLPCGDKAGIASLLDRPSIYKGFYHSQKMQLHSTHSGGILLDQTLTVVLQPSELMPNLVSDPLLQPSWSIRSLFRRTAIEQCVLAMSSVVYLEIENSLVAEFEKLGSIDSWGKFGFELPVTPSRILKPTMNMDALSAAVLYEYNLINYSETEPLDIGLRWKAPFSWSCSKAPFHARRFLMGSGNERGSIAISLQSTQSHYSHLDTKVVIFQIVPWYVKVYYHTLKIYIDGEEHNMSSVVEKMQVHPSEDKLSPGTMELMLILSYGVQSAVLTIDFDKGFLHIDEYPPDANQGFDIPSAIVSFPDFQASTYFFKEKSAEQQTPLLHKFQEESTVQSYTEVLLVPLTTPDFSMPYNVITFTCTVLALYFGSLLNAIRRRVNEEQRLLNLEATKQGLVPLLFSKLSLKFRGKKPESASSSDTTTFVSPKLLLKVFVVAIAAVIWHYFLNDQ